MRKTILVLLLGLALTAFAVAGCGGDNDNEAGGTDTTDTTETETTTVEAGATLVGTVGPGFTISLETEDGAPVTSLPAGSYSIEIEDLSSAHNFHLTGPGGIDMATDVAAEETVTWDVEVEPGTYEYVCDPHASQMNGSFEVTA